MIFEDNNCVHQNRIQLDYGVATGPFVTEASIFLKQTLKRLPTNVLMNLLVVNS
jgi:hypothetical protein